jgi:hypothetical protein
VAELVDALVSNTCGKPYRFDSGPGYKMAKRPLNFRGLFRFRGFYHKITPFTILRGIDYVGVNYTGPELDSLMDNCDFEALVKKYF